MIDWDTVGKIWIGYGINILVLTILLTIAWLIGLLVVKSAKKTAEGKKNTK